MGKLSSAIKTGQSAIEMGRNVQGLASAASDLRNADKGDMGRKAGRFAFNEGADVGKTAGKTWLKTFEVIPRLVCRVLQFLFAIIAVGFYGNRVESDDKDDDGFSPEWILAITVSGLSAFTAIIFLAVTPLSALPIIGSRLKLFKTYRAFAWDLILFVGWLVVFALFAAIFLHRDDDDSYKGANVPSQRAFVWIDMVNSLFWLVSGGYGSFKVYMGTKADQMTDKVGGKIFERKGPVKDIDAESV
jgi:membrane protein implicated in regulation of membrane protease activity